MQQAKDNMGDDAILKIILTVGSMLSGAVLVLFKVVMTQNKAQIEMSKDIGELKGKQTGIKDLSKEVLDTVHVSILEKNSMVAENSKEIVKIKEELKKD